MKIPANQDLFIRPEEQHRIDDLFDHWEKRKRFNLWRVAVLSILLFAGVFILNMVMDQTEVSPLPVSVTAVDTSHLLDGPSHQEYFTQNKPVFDTSAAKTEENPEIQNGLQPAVSEDVPLLAHSADSILFYESPSEIDRHIISPPVTPPNPSANHGIVPPQEETAAVIPPFSPPSTALAALWSVPFPEAAATPSVPAAPPSEIVSFPVSETPHVTPLSPAAFSVEPVEPPEYSGVLPSSSTPMVSMQILPPGSTEQTISAETNSRNTPSPTSLSSPYSRIQVITHGTTPSVNEVMKRSLPPLTPITPAGPSSQSSSQGSEPVDENKTSFDRNSAISQVGFTAPTAASFTDIRTTILKLSEENIAFTARDEHSIWERAVNEKSLQSDEFLLVPAPFRAVIRTGGGLKLTVFGDTRLRFLQDGTGMMFDYGTIQILTEEVIGFPVTYRIKTPQGSGTFLFSGPNSCVMLRSTDGTPPEYSPNLVVRPGTHGTVLWASDLHQESQFAIQRDAKITLNSTSPHEPVFLEGDVIKETMPVSIPDITAQNLCRKMKTSPTLESALEEFLSDTSPDIRYWGCRWCAELGRVDLPVKHLRQEPAGSPRQTRLADYIHEIKSRDPKTAQRMELAEKHFAGTND
ncbi:MAG: hypothetical protein LBQ54_02155 [Planctomycetaceae bacterium]|jgi:hypothetical protein|nr:hypothetical protein [Planctomycetaceae bacterium]